MRYILAVNLFATLVPESLQHEEGSHSSLCALYGSFLHIVVTNHIRNATWGPIQCYYFCKGACDLYRLLLLD